MHGVAIPRASAKSSLVICHGNRSSKEKMYHLINCYQDHNLFFFDFRGHGENQAEYTTIGDLESYDVEGAVAYARQLFPNTPLGIVALSMGAGATLKALSSIPDLCNAVVLDSAYASLQDMVERVYDGFSPLPRFPLLDIGMFFARFRTGCKFDVNSESYIANLQVPAMLIHSVDDPLIPVNHADRLIEAARRGTNMVKQVLKCSGAGHGAVSHVHSEQYTTNVNDFFGIYLK